MEKISTKDRILTAAYKVFSKSGYSGATTLAISKEAEVNEVTLFRHFGNKQKLFAETIKKYSAIPHIEAARLLKDVPVEKAIRVLSHNIMGILDELKSLIAILLSEGPRQPKEGRAILEGGPGQVLINLTGWFTDMKKTGQIRDIDPECAARAFMGMFFSYMVIQKILPGDQVFPIDPQLVVDNYIEIFLRGVLPKETGNLPNKNIKGHKR